MAIILGKVHAASRDGAALVRSDDDWSLTESTRAWSLDQTVRPSAPQKHVCLDIIALQAA